MKIVTMPSFQYAQDPNPSYQSAQILTELVNHTLETKKCTISNFNVEGTQLSIEQWVPWGS